MEDIASLYTVGDPVRVAILSIDEEKKRLSLGLKQSYFENDDDEMDFTIAYKNAATKRKHGQDDDDEEEEDGEDEDEEEGFTNGQFDDEDEEDVDADLDEEEEQEDEEQEDMDVAPAKGKLLSIHTARNNVLKILQHLGPSMSRLVSLGMTVSRLSNPQRRPTTIATTRTTGTRRVNPQTARARSQSAKRSANVTKPRPALPLKKRP